MADSTESEFKLRARQAIEVAAVDAALRELGVACRLSESLHHSDTYLDDEFGSLHRNGIGLRLREGRKGRRLTCKTRGRLEGSMHVRREVEATWHREELPRSAAELPEELRDVVQPFVLDRSLRPRQRLEVQREIRVLTEDGADLCELAIDSVEALANGRSATFQEVELEVIDDVPTNERIAHELRERLPIEFATDDKPTHAAALLGIEHPDAAPHRPTKKQTRRERGSQPAGQAVVEQLRDGLATMRRYEIGVREGSDPEDLHQMRVTIRRMRSLARAFRALWPEEVASRLLCHLGETGRRLGTVRDLDVMLERLPAELEALPPQLQPAGRRTLDWVHRQRAAAHAQMQAWLRSPERLTANDQFERDAAAIDERAPLAAEPMAQAAPALLAREVANLRKQVAAIPAELPTEPLHRLRLTAKRTRYLAEQFADLPGMDYRKSLRAVARVQQRLGVVCDHEVACERLLGWVHAASADSTDGAWTAAALGGLSAVHAVAATVTRAVAADALERLDRKRVWKRFPSA
jgi:CHAD domain-containing protein